MNFLNSVRIKIMTRVTWVERINLKFKRIPESRSFNIFYGNQTSLIPVLYKPFWPTLGTRLFTSIRNKFDVNHSDMRVRPKIPQLIWKIKQTERT